MSQQTPQNRPQRPQAPQQQGQQQYPPPQQGYQQQPQYPPQNYQQQPQYPPQQQAPRQQSGGSNPNLTVLKWIAWPFLKVGGWLLGLINVVIHEILRSTVRLIFGVIFFGLFIALTAAYIIALVQTNYNFA